MKADALISELKRKFSISTDRELASRLGMTAIQIGNWKRRKKALTPRQVANAIEKASHAAVTKAHRSMIRPIVEFFPLDATESRAGVKYELFPTTVDGKPSYQQLRNALADANGIYIFYDTRGRAIYAGKAKQQSLWREMKSAFNRARDTQTVYRVRHPTSGRKFVAAHEKPRQPLRTQLKLNDLAAYVSAYEVDPGMINDLEALLVRGFANDLLNARMERFAGSRPRKKGGA
ncbi:GIY-YIG nuclease family protein [Thioalkalivibrio thiocyanodenitrificans]|uniref:hypothetical protein n=1 Tax=Thioalkalivibrio thiocyanodenitrificans TaxID=243063 RepID=UPI0003614912|nr:hypothetical protein [Thioalkalivibrio thiocyanodenitrificans]